MRLWGFISLMVCSVLVAGVDSGLPAGQATPPREATEEEVGLFVSYLREHFDDIHDVSMRFHARDPSIAGTIALELIWDQGRLFDARVANNETGNEAEGLAMIEALRHWRVEFTGRDSGVDPVPAARTSREGIFVRTLIPPGTWEITCLAEGYSPVVLHAVELTAGQHRIEEFTLHPVEQAAQPSEGAKSDE